MMAVPITRRRTDGGLYARVDLETLVRLANAHKVEGKVGAKNFTLARAHQQAIKAFIEYFAQARSK